MSDKAVITCALNGVLTDPEAAQRSRDAGADGARARAAFDAGASVMHIHLAPAGTRQGICRRGRSASAERSSRRCARLPGRIINHTPALGPNYPARFDCVRETVQRSPLQRRSLNYLKVKSDNTWAWPPMMFDNAVEKVQDYLDVIKWRHDSRFECFDVRIVRCVGMYRQTGMYSARSIQFRDGRRIRHAADPDLLPILLKLKLPRPIGRSPRSGRAEIWPPAPALRRSRRSPAHRARDTFYLADGKEGDLERPVDRSIAACARRAGREIASPAEREQIFGTRH